MSDVSKTNELIARGIWATHPHRGDSWEHELDLIKVECWERAEALDATRVPVQGEPKCECWPTEEKYHFVHFGATEPGSAFEYNPECPEHGEPNDEPCLGCGSAAEDGHDDCTIKVRTFRATVPDAATEELRADKMTAEEAIESVLKRPWMYGLVDKGGHRCMKDERDAALAAVERARATAISIGLLGKLQPGDHSEILSAAVKDILAALDVAPEPEPEPESEVEMYQAGCGSWDCRAPECGRA